MHPERRDGRIGVRVSHRPDSTRAAAFTLIELIVVLSLLGLLIAVVQTSLFGALRRSSFRSQVQQFVSAMQMAASAAAESSRRYEVSIDISEQMYRLREITTSDLDDVRDEEIIMQGHFGRNCRVVSVEFDDHDYTNEGLAHFRVGHAGWHYGGKILLLDEDEQPHAVVVSRVTPIVTLVDGDPALMAPKSKDEVPAL
jgi:prepilin-type N-terminal cleavage/methylation domain-containing protein